MQGISAAQKDSENKELIAKLHQERMDSTFQRDMLQFLIQDEVQLDVDDIIQNRQGVYIIINMFLKHCCKYYSYSSILTCFGK